MKDKIYLVSPNFIEEKVKKIFENPGELGFTVLIGLLTGLREQEIIYIKEKSICNDGYGCDCDKLHIVNCKNGMIVISIGWTRGNNKQWLKLFADKHNKEIMSQVNRAGIFII